MTMSLRTCRALVAGAVLMALLAAPRAHAEDDNPHLEQAQQALAALEYEAALHSLEKALFSGRNGPEELRTVYRLLGEIHGALGHPAKAEQHFRRLLALDLDAGLSEGVSPKILAPFSAAQKYMRSRGTLSARCEMDEASSSAIVHVVSDPLGQVAGARVVYRAAEGVERVVDARGHAPLALAVPVRDRVELVCAALDEHGNRLIDMGSWDQPMVLTAAARNVMSRSPAPPPRPFYARWYLWGALAVAAAGGGTYFALEARAAQDELDILQRNSMDHSYSEAEEVEKRGKRNALLANIGFGAAGAFALVSAITWGLRPERPTGESTAAVAPLPMRDGAGVSVRLSF